MATENQKIPCGGFRIGDGLTMDGDTLKSLGGGKYVKINITVKGWVYSIDSPIQTYEELKELFRKQPIVCWDGLRTYDASNLTLDGYPRFQSVDISSGKIEFRRFIFKPENEIEEQTLKQ